MFTWLGGLIEGMIIMGFFGGVIIGYLKKGKTSMEAKAKELEGKLHGTNSQKKTP